MSYKWWLVIAVSLFGIGWMSGLVTNVGADNILVGDMVGIEELFGYLLQMPQWALFIFIFLKNVSVVVISFVFSPVLCLVPVIALTFNGWIAGFVSKAVAQEESLVYVLSGLLPHGIFELPALIMGEAVALSFGAAVILYPFRKDGRQRVIDNFKHNYRFLIAACGLLLPAAIIETWVTPLLLQ